MFKILYNTSVALNVLPLILLFVLWEADVCSIANRCWTFLWLTHIFFWLVTGNSLAKWYVTWKYMQSIGVKLKSYGWKIPAPTDTWQITETIQWMWTQVVSNVTQQEWLQWGVSQAMFQMVLCSKANPWNEECFENTWANVRGKIKGIIWWRNGMSFQRDFLS